VTDGTQPRRTLLIAALACGLVAVVLGLILGDVIATAAGAIGAVVIALVLTGR
jgi:hypothetical protein